MFNRRSFAVFVLAAVSLPAQSALDQLKAYKDGAATPAQAAKQSATVAEATAQKYDILGIKVGMSVRDALGALKVHSPNFRLTPQSLKYDLVPNPLTYGIWAVTPNVTTAGGGPPDSEQFYFMLATPPNPQQVLTRVTRLVRWSLNTAPVLDTLASDLIRKYGAPSFDSGAAEVNDKGGRELVWVDDARGNRVQNKDAMVCRQDSSGTTFNQPAVAGGLNTINIPPDVGRVKSNIEQGYLALTSEQCSQFTMIQANLYDTRSLRYPPAPNVAGGLLMTIGSGPMDRGASEATHEFLVQAQKNRDANQTKAAEQNRPKL